MLVPCGNMEHTVKGLLSRTESLGIRPVSYRLFKHPERDPGCCLRGADFLRGYADTCKHGLLLFDREGCGRENLSREDLEAQVNARLRRSGWDDRAAVVVLDPELEIWVWSDSPHVDGILGWTGRQPTLRAWLVQEGFIEENQIKPSRPKEAMRQALRIVRKPATLAMFQQLAMKVRFRTCQDPAFLKLTNVLRQWFGVEG